MDDSVFRTDGKKINVLHLIGSFNQGGSERQALQLAAQLSRTDRFHIELGVLRDEGPLRVLVEDEGLTRPHTFPLRAFYKPGFLREVGRFRKLVQAREIDIVHSHDFYTNVFGIIGSMANGGRPLVIASKRETHGTRTRAQSFVEQRLFQHADAIVANSSAVHEFLLSHGVRKSVEVIHNGIAVGDFEPETVDRLSVTRGLGLPDGEDVRFITFVANLSLPVKNQDMLLRAASRLSGIHPEAHFVFAGEGSRENDLAMYARELGVSDRTHFIGRCMRVPDLLRISFAGVLTSNAEGFSNSVLEYMAARLPVVATDVGGAREAIEDGVSGFVIPVDDDEALAEKLTLLLGDAGMAARLGQRGREIMGERFSLDAQLKKTMALYERLLASRMRGAKVGRNS